MIRTTLFASVCLFAVGAYTAPALAQDSMNLEGTIIRIQPTSKPGAVAEVVINNQPSNDHWDNRTFPLAIAGLVITGRFEWEYLPDGSDAVHVTPPDGLMCIPFDCILTAPEGGVGTLWLFEAEGIGA